MGEINSQEELEAVIDLTKYEFAIPITPNKNCIYDSNGNIINYIGNNESIRLMYDSSNREIYRIYDNGDQVFNIYCGGIHKIHFIGFEGQREQLFSIDRHGKVMIYQCIDFQSIRSIVRHPDNTLSSHYIDFSDPKSYEKLHKLYEAYKKH